MTLEFTDIFLYRFG